MIVRLVYLFVLVLFSFFAPWWVLGPLVAMAIWRFPYFYEVVLPAMIFDSLFSAAGVTPVGFTLMFTFFTVAAVYLAEKLKLGLLFSLNR